MKDARKEQIVTLLKTYGPSSRETLSMLMKRLGLPVSRITLQRDLNELILGGQVKKSGTGRTTKYVSSGYNELSTPMDLDAYFAADWMYRPVRNLEFDFKIFDQLSGLITDEEKERADGVAEIYWHQLEKLSPALGRQAWNNFIVEFAWKSSMIEGNKYTLFDTEFLVNNGILCEGGSALDARMILNHVEAMKFIQQNLPLFAKPTVSTILRLHQVMTVGLGVNQGIRSFGVRISGTKYTPLSYLSELNKAMEKLSELLLCTSHPVERALLAVLLVSYIQPFEDGNKRTGRTLANAILMSENLCPISWYTADVRRFKKSLMLFYEQSNYSCFKELFLEEYKRSVDRYV